MVARWQTEASSWGSWDIVFRMSMSGLLSQEQLRQLLYCAWFMRLFHVNIYKIKKTLLESVPTQCLRRCRSSATESFSGVRYLCYKSAAKGNTCKSWT